MSGLERFIRPFPDEAKTPGAGRAFIAAYRKAFDADPLATFVAAEVDGLTVVVAVGSHGERLQRFVKSEFDGVIEKRSLAAVSRCEGDPT